jgi:hypothetical protein
MYDVADTGDYGQPENTDDKHSETGESTDEETNVFHGKDFTWSRTPPTVAHIGSAYFWSGQRRAKCNNR